LDDSAGSGTGNEHRSRLPVSKLSQDAVQNSLGEENLSDCWTVLRFLLAEAMDVSSALWLWRRFSTLTPPTSVPE
jgi:hypothetical protein